MTTTEPIKMPLEVAFSVLSSMRMLYLHAGGGGGNSEGHVGVGKREVRGGDERGVGGGARRAGRRG